MVRRAGLERKGASLRGGRSILLELIIRLARRVIESLGRDAALFRLLDLLANRFLVPLVVQMAAKHQQLEHASLSPLCACVRAPCIVRHVAQCVHACVHRAWVMVSPYQSTWPLRHVM